MNKIKKNKGLRLLTMILCFVILLSACGGGNSTGGQESDGPQSNEAEYKVTVADVLGNPYNSGVIVAFLSNGQQVAMQNVDENGVAAKTLEKGDYTVELMFTGDESAYHYDQADMTLSADKTELTVTLANALTGEASSLVVEDEERPAYNVNEGCTYVDLTAGERNYFLFTPTTAGTYEFSVADSTAQIGYYGAPYFVQSASAAEVTDNTFTVSVRADMIGADTSGTTVLVIGVDAGEEENCVLTIERIGDPEWSLADEPWTVYEPTVELAPYTLPAGATINEFDLTAATDTYNLVLNETDGFYHLDSADGPLVLVRLGQKSQYLDDYKTILEHTGVSKYFFDENGEFVKKERYTDCLLQYIECMDEDNGVYPLTNDLMYIIQNHGDHSGWYDIDNPGYLFKDQDGNLVPGINAEIAWLFMCCYIN